MLNELKLSEVNNKVSKLNAGKSNENIKHDFSLVMKLNNFLGLFSSDLELNVIKKFHASDIFPN